MRGDSAHRDVYQVRWAPLPNWGQYLLLMGLMDVVPAPVACRLVTVLTLVGFAASVLWYEDAGAPGAGSIRVLRPRARSAAAR